MLYNYLDVYNVKEVMDMEYENEIYGLICDLKEYAKEAIKNNYIDTIINYDLKRIIGRVVDGIVDKEEDYWREKWEDACDNARNMFD